MHTRPPDHDTPEREPAHTHEETAGVHRRDSLELRDERSHSDGNASSYGAKRSSRDDECGGERGSDGDTGRASASEVQSNAHELLEHEYVQGEALEVRVHWGAQLLHVAHLCPPRPFVLGEDDDADFVLPHSVLGGAPLVLPAEDHARVAGGFAFRVRRVEAAAPVGGARPPLGVLLREHAWLVGSLALHLTLLLLFGLMPPSASAISIDDLSTSQRYLPITLMPDATVDPPDEHTIFGDDGGQDGAKEDGTEQSPDPEGKAGSPGKPDAPARKRTAMAPPSAPVQQSADPLAAARSGGILGILAAAAARSDSASLFDADQAHANDAGDAYGRLLGAAVAGNGLFGFAGNVGPGRGSTGSAAGTIGSGPLHTAGRDGTGIGNYKPGLPGRGPRQRGPILRPGQPKIMGGLSKEIIRRRIGRQRAQIRHCYEQGLRGRPDLEGRVAIKFMVDASGQVRVAVPTSSSLGHPETEQCIASVIRRIDFPQPEGGMPVSVTYPFVLSRP